MNGHPCQFLAAAYPRAGWSRFTRILVSIDTRPRSARIPDSVLRRYEALLDQARTRRRALGLTQEDVAEVLGISKSQMANFERGYSILSVPRLLLLAGALKTTAGVLLASPRRRRR